MIDGLMLAVALLGAPAGLPLVEPPRPAAALTPATLTFEVPDQPGATSRRSGRFAATEQSRQVWRAAAFSAPQATTAKRFTKTDRVIAITAGVVGGWLGGGAIGYYATQDRENDDDGTSGLKGVMIGAPIGAAVGGILGYWLTKN